MNPYAPPASDPDGVSPPALEARLQARFMPNYGDVLRLRARQLISGVRIWTSLACVLLLLVFWLMPDLLPDPRLRLALVFGALTVLLFQPLTLLLVALWFACARAIRRPNAVRDTLTLALDGDGFELRASAYRMQFQWHGVRRVQRRGALISLHTAAGFTYLVPRRAFATEADFRHFAEVAGRRSRVARHAHKNKPAEALP